MGLCRERYFCAAIAVIRQQHPDAELFVFTDEPNQVRHWMALQGLAAGTYPLFKLTANWKWDRWVGELSYPLYLVHMAVLWVLYPRAKGATAIKKPRNPVSQYIVISFFTNSLRQRADRL